MSQAPKRDWVRRIVFTLLAVVLLGVLAAAGLYLYEVGEENRIAIVVGAAKLQKGMTEEEVEQMLDAKPLPWSEKFVYDGDKMFVRRAYRQTRNGWFVITNKELIVEYIDGKLEKWKFR